MTKLTRTQFKTKWGTRFPDNNSGEIEEGDLREFKDDIADSALPDPQVAGIFMAALPTFAKGTSLDLTVSGGINPNDESSLTNRRVRKGGAFWQNFATNSFSFTDTILDTTTYTAEVTTESGTKTVSQVATAVFPYYSGAGPANGFTPATEHITGKTSRAVTFNLSEGRMYYDVWAGATGTAQDGHGPLASAIDPNGANILESFEIINIIRSFPGFPDQKYRRYRNLENLNVSNFTVTFNHN